MFRSKLFRPLLLSVLLTGIPIAVLFILQWHFLTQLRLATADVLRQASDDAAVDLAQKIRRDFGWPAFNLLERVDHADIRDLRFEGVEQTIRERAGRLRFVDRVFLWSKNRRVALPACDGSGAPVYFLAVRPTIAEGELPEPPVSCDADLAAAVLGTGIDLANLRASFTVGELSVRGRSYQLVYHFLYDHTEQRVGLSAFIGFAVDSGYLREGYFPAVVAETLAAAHGGRPQSPPLAVSIVDDEGREVYKSGRSLLASHDGRAPFPFLFFDTELLESLSPAQRHIRYWNVHTGYAEADVATFVNRQQRPQQALWLLIGLAAVAGVALTVRATYHERHVAQLKSEFVASVSHELKTPLAKIQLFADTLASGRTRTPERAQAYYGILRGQALKLGYLIEMMLEFARIEAGSREYPLEEVNLLPIVERALASFDDELTLKEFTIETALAVREAPVRGNTEGLLQLFGNLIGNAIKYSGDARYLFVGLRVADGHAVVDIADRGVGIPREEHRRIFRKFYRARAGAGRPAGSGLGLAIVAHVARAHRATVTVDSEPGRGARFTVRVPLLDPEDTAS